MGTPSQAQTGLGSFITGLAGGMTRAKQQQQQAAYQRALFGEKAAAETADRAAAEKALAGKQAFDADQNRLNRENQLRIAGMKQPEDKPSPFRKKADETYAKDYVDWTQVGSADVEAQLANLKGSIDTLNTDKSITGPVRGLLPDWARSFSNPAAVDTKANIADVTQRTLKSILGAQFTVKEGDRVIKNAYDDRLPPEKNIARLNRLYAKIGQMAKAKSEMAAYAERNGTLEGYTGRAPSVADLGEFLGDGAPAGAGTLDPAARLAELEAKRAAAGKR